MSRTDNSNRFQGFRKISKKTVLSFLLTLTLCFLLIFFSLANRTYIEKLTMEQLILEKSLKVNEVITKLVYKTQALSALVIQGNGEIRHFERVAATLLDDPSILNVIIAPSGVVADVYPLAGNEKVLGYNLLGEGAGNKEAIEAKESKSLVFGGPFNLIQGGQALVGRLPVFLDQPDGNKKFWGLVTITLKYPQVLKDAGLDTLELQGFAYEIWRISPDDNEKQIIASSNFHYNDRTPFIEKHLPILNADWYFRILPVRLWYEYAENWTLIVISISISLLVAFVVQNNHELKSLKTKLENLAYTDGLTGIFNRRHFMEHTQSQMERELRLQNNSYVIVFDIDYFKRVNDNYGHMAGDELLKSLVLRVKNVIRSYDVFARFGGEEFILFVADSNEETVVSLAERIRIVIGDIPFEINNITISVTVSLGIAQVTPINNLETAINLADEALYKAKNDGRNRTILHNETFGL